MLLSLNNIKDSWTVAKKAYQSWSAREPFNNSIIIAYYTIFSLPGLLVVVIAVAAYFFDKEQVTTNITGEINRMLGSDAGKDIESIVSKASERKKGVIASILGVAVLLFGATGVFFQVQKILNKIWEVQPDPKQKGVKKILKFIKDRIFSFGLILVIGFLLLVSLVLSSGLSALGEWIASHVSESLLIVFKCMDIVVSVGIITCLFAMMFKFLPDAKIKWSDVWHGAFLTAVLFVIAKFALGLYFGKSDPGSTYGAAGSIILVMLWVSYAGMILLYGAEFTQVYAAHHGRIAEPVPGAVHADTTIDNGAVTDKEKHVKKKKDQKHGFIHALFHKGSNA